MINDNGTMRYSATDITRWLSCAHASRLDALLRTDQELKAWKATHTSSTDGDSARAPAAVRGDEHELAMLQGLIESGLEVVEIPRPAFDDRDGLSKANAATLEALRAGADVVFQAALVDGPWFGYADFLVRVDGVSSLLGDYAYEVRDTKLARHPSASALIQMAHYGAMVEQIQQAPPPRLVIWLGTGALFEWPYRDAVPYLREAQKAFLQFQKDLPETLPIPKASCAGCRWFDHCDEEWGAEDLRNVHRLSSRQREVLRASGITTIAELAAATDDARPDAIGVDTFGWLREQAQVQGGGDDWLIISPQSATAGVFGTPKPHPDDMYFDLEGDPFAAIPTLDYLWAYCDVDGTYHHRWAHSPDEEREAFLWFLNVLREREKRGGDWKVYHYNTYEVTSMCRIAHAWPDDTERDELIADVERLIAERFDDLYRRIDVGLRTRAGSTSLKIVEKLAGYDRTAEAAAVARADDSIKAYEAFIASDDESKCAAILEGIRQYNVHDVRATNAVHRWLWGITCEPSIGPDTATATDATGRQIDLLHGDEEQYVQSDKVRERIESTEQLRDLLIAAADSADAQASSASASSQLPSGLSAHAARLLAEMLEWHRRESVVAFLDSKRLEAWALGQGSADAASIPDAVEAIIKDLNGSADSELTAIRPGTEHESCLLDIEGPIEIHPPQPGKRVSTYEYRCRPGAWKVKKGSDVKTVSLGDGGESLTVKLVAHDPQTGMFSFTRTKNPGELDRMVLAPFFDPPTVWERLMDLARAALAESPAPWTAVPFDALDRRPPADAGTMVAVTGESASDRARRIVSQLPTGLLPVQGPPGTGKTHLGCDLIMDQLKAGGRGGSQAIVAVTANSHKVMDNLLVSVAMRAAADGVRVKVAHLGSGDQVDVAAGIEAIAGGGGKLAGWIDAAHDEGHAVVVAATKFGWSRADVSVVADLLIIDEAGQLPLADALAVCSTAGRVVALGDPQQLAAPIQAAHDDSVRVSLLEHIVGGAAVMPTDVGVFLDVTYRMHPAVCRVVADLAYDGELVSSTQAAARTITGTDVSVAGQTVTVEPGVSWLPVDGGTEAEVTAVRELVDGLIGKVQVTDEHGTSALTGSDILVVAPHNAHVNRLDAELGQLGVRVGTVDKFQGQQAHVVVYSMGRLAVTAGDVPFLYEVNRVNVALSRARLMAIVVSDPKAVLPPVNSPEQLMMASRFAAAVAGD